MNRMNNSGDIKKLADEIIQGRRINRQDDLTVFLTCDLEELCKGADRKREYFCGDKVDLCTIINGRSGRCGEDCKYCAQSVHNHTSCEIYDFLDSEEIIREALSNEKEGVDRFSIVTHTDQCINANSGYTTSGSSGIDRRRDSEDHRIFPLYQSGSQYPSGSRKKADGK